MLKSLEHFNAKVNLRTRQFFGLLKISLIFNKNKKIPIEERSNLIKNRCNVMMLGAGDDHKMIILISIRQLNKMVKHQFNFLSNSESELIGTC